MASTTSVLTNLIIAPPKQTIAQRIEHWVLGEDDTILFQELAETANAWKDSVGYRWQSKSTLSRQDSALYDYRRLISLYLKKGGMDDIDMLFSAGEESNDKFVFPSDSKLLTEYIGCYLVFLARNILGDKRPRMSTLLLRRSSMWYWCNAGGLAPNPPAANYFFMRTTESLQFIKTSIGFDRTQKKKNYLGLNELIQLIEYDMMYTPSIAVAEQQHVAWLLGYLCGVRPGSISVSKFKNESETLSWGDIDIRRQLTADGVWEGQFVAKITFKYLKQTEDQHIDGADLRMTILSPRTNPILSLPHRLLIIALRRDLLQHYKSIDGLMLGREEKVLFREEAKCLPVLLATSARGLSLLDRPAHSKALTDYIRPRAQWLGYDGVTTFYAWRRKFGTQIERAAGAEKARSAMAHSFASNVYEQYYDQGLYDLNNTSILIDRGDGRDLAVTENLESMALTRSVHLKHIKSRDKALAEFVNSHSLVKDAVAGGATPESIKQVKKRLRRKALDAMLRNEQAIQLESRTVDEIRDRIEELRKPSALIRMIDRRIKEKEREDQGCVRSDLLQQSAEDFRDAEEELESGEIIVQNPTNITTPDVDDDSSLPVSSKTATAFMELLMEFATQKPTTTCSLCAASQWRTQEERDHDWVDQTKLRRHMDGREHTPYWEFRAKMMCLVSERADGKYFCPYGCSNLYETFRTLVRHIKEHSKTGDERHEALKIADGWYEESWFGDKTHAPRNNRPTVRRKRDLHEHDEDIDENLLNTSKRKASMPFAVLRGVEKDLYVGSDAGAYLRESVADFTYVAPGGHSTSILLEGLADFTFITPGGHSTSILLEGLADSIIVKDKLNQFSTYS